MRLMSDCEAHELSHVSFVRDKHCQLGREQECGKHVEFSTIFTHHSWPAASPYVVLI